MQNLDISSVAVDTQAIVTRAAHLAAAAQLRLQAEHQLDPEGIPFACMKYVVPLVTLCRSKQNLAQHIFICLAVESPLCSRLTHRCTSQRHADLSKHNGCALSAIRHCHKKHRLACIMSAFVAFGLTAESAWGLTCAENDADMASAAPESIPQPQPEPAADRAHMNGPHMSSQHQHAPAFHKKKKGRRKAENRGVVTQHSPAQEALH